MSLLRRFIGDGAALAVWQTALEVDWSEAYGTGDAFSRKLELQRRPKRASVAAVAKYIAANWYCPHRLPNPFKPWPLSPPFHPTHTPSHRIQHMRSIKEESLEGTLSLMHLPVSEVMHYVRCADDLVLFYPTHDAVDGFLCEGRRLRFALFSTGPPLKQYYKWPPCAADPEHEEICQAWIDTSTGRIKIQWRTFASFLGFLRAGP